MPNQPPWDIRERSFQFACAIVRFCRKLSEVGGCRPIADQLLRAGTSVGANLEEARAAYSRREFAMKNNYALKECREAHFWLRIIDRCALVPNPAETRQLTDESGQLVAILTVTVKNLRRERTNRNEVPPPG